MPQRTEARKCKTCMHVIDGLSPIDPSEKSPPKEGDISICIYCATISVFDAEFNLQAMEQTEIQQFKKEQPEDWDILYKMSLHIARKNKLN